SIAALNAYQNNGISCVIKHFPGNTNTDPHTGLPEIKMTSDEMKETLKPFKSVVSHNPEGVLMSHARTEITDGAFGDSSFSSEPSCFSSYWVTDVLRGEYGFSGIIFSDDIFMGALADNGYPPDVAAVKAIEAGVDCIMISEKRFLKPALTLIEKAKTDENFAKRIDESCRRILKYKIENGQLTIDNCSLIGCR
ncbi:MAG: glycoside hydrolase family 3 protein, partial [Treponema sp.]|nr:glycoside hydrolase family 3 protein [Treponema sp.]